MKRKCACVKWQWVIVQKNYRWSQWNEIQHQNEKAIKFKCTLQVNRHTFILIFTLLCVLHSHKTPSSEWVRCFSGNDQIGWKKQKHKNQISFSIDHKCLSHYPFTQQQQQPTHQDQLLQRGNDQHSVCRRKSWARSHALYELHWTESLYRPLWISSSSRPSSGGRLSTENRDSPAC